MPLLGAEHLVEGRRQVGERGEQLAADLHAPRLAQVEGEQVEGDELGGEGLGRGDADLRAGVGVDRARR